MKAPNTANAHTRTTPISLNQGEVVTLTLEPEAHRNDMHRGLRHGAITVKVSWQGMAFGRSRLNQLDLGCLSRQCGVTFAHGLAWMEHLKTTA